MSVKEDRHRIFPILLILCVITLAGYLNDVAYAAVHTITAWSGAGGTIYPPGKLSVVHSMDQEFTITPNECYQIEDVILDENQSVKDDVKDGVYILKNITSDHEIHVEFARRTCTLTVTWDGEGTVSPSGEIKEVSCGDTLSFGIIPDKCHYVQDVIVDDQSVIDDVKDGVYILANVTADHKIHVEFVKFPQDTYTLTVIYEGSGTILPFTPSGKVPLACGDTVYFLMMPDPYYYLEDAELDGESVMDDVLDGRYTIENVTSDHEMHVVFAKKKYTVTVTCETGGNILESGQIILPTYEKSASITVAWRDSITFDIEPESCYVIGQVYLGQKVNGRTDVTEVLDKVAIDDKGKGIYTLENIQDNYTIHFSFSKKTYRIDTIENHCYIQGEEEIPCGNDAPFIIIPHSGYRLDDVLADGVSVKDALKYCGEDGKWDGEEDCEKPGSYKYTFESVTKDYTLEANFVLEIYTISVEPATNGSISPDGDVKVTSGHDKDFTIIPDPCYRIEDVTVDGMSVMKSVTVDEDTGIGTYTFENVQRNFSMAAKFVIKTYTVKATAGSRGSIEPEGDLVVNCGHSQVFVMAPDPCYRVFGVQVDGVSVMSFVAIDPDTFMGIYTLENIQADTTIKATFDMRVHEVISTAGDNGSIAPEGRVVVPCGRQHYSFTITPDPCYYIYDVLVNSESAMDDVSIDENTGAGQYQLQNIRRDMKVEAIFARYVYTIEAEAGQYGSITPGGDTQVSCGDSMTFTITPDPCYYIHDVLVGVVLPGDGAVDMVSVMENVEVDKNTGIGKYTFDKVATSYIIQAKFSRKIYTISATADEYGSIYPSGKVEVYCGADRDFYITPDQHFHILDVKVDGLSMGPISQYNFPKVVSDHDIHAAFEPDPVSLVDVSYGILTGKLTFRFTSPVDPQLINFPGIGMEINDSGNWDLNLSRVPEVGVIPEETEPSTEININLHRNHIITVSLGVAWDNNAVVDILLMPGVFTNIYGGRSLEIKGTDDFRLKMFANGFMLGKLGDVDGNGMVNADDARLILQSTISNPADVFPSYKAASEASEWLVQMGYDRDIMLSMADVSGNGGISSYDAALALRLAENLSDSAPEVTGSPRNCRLNIRSYDSRRLEASVDLDVAAGVYSADIVMKYNPSLLKVEAVSETSAVSGWLCESGGESGRLRISLAGTASPGERGSLVNVCFYVTEASDCIPGIELLEVMLNEDLVKARVENLPSAFALLQNYPNPFNPETWIPYRISEPVDVTISIYSANGQLVRRIELGRQMPGHYVDKSKAAYWDGRNETGEAVSSGVYFYRFQAGNYEALGKMTVVR